MPVPGLMLPREFYRLFPRQVVYVETEHQHTWESETIGEHHLAQSRKDQDNPVHCNKLLWSKPFQPSAEIGKTA